MRQVFVGLRVVDLTQGMAGPLAAMILADFGADVIRLEPPGGDPMWTRPAYMLWNRGKRSVELDWGSAQGREQARELVRGADIFIESLPPGRADELGVGYEESIGSNPSLVYFSISAFGQHGPYKHLKASDGIVNAKSGRMREQVGWQVNRPTFRAVNDTSYHTAMFTVQSLVAGLRVAWMTGRGQRLDTSLMSGLTAPNNAWRRLAGVELPPDRYPNQVSTDAVRRGELVPDRHESDPYTATPTQLCTQTQDGRWIMHAHIQLPLFRAWIDAIDLGWIWTDPRYQNAPKFASDADRIALNLLIFERMKQKTAAEWREVYRQHPNCAGETMQTTQEALHHEQFVQNGHVVEVHDPRVGRMKQVGAFARLSETPAVIEHPAPLPGEHTAEILATRHGPRRPIEPTGPKPKRPLEGIVMLEVATWLAAPFSGALLADLGARVIKVETVSGDPFRAMSSNENMIRAMQGKESIALDLKTKEGQDILHKLVAKADTFMHNFRPGAPERIGADYETLRKIKPDLVYVYAASYGSKGPDALRAAFNPTMGAFSGNSVFQSGDGNTPKGDQSPDPIAGSGVATAIMLGLAARLRTGKGQYVEASMMVSNVYCNSDDAFDYRGKPLRWIPDKSQLGLEATYRLYEAKDGWVFLAAQHDSEFATLCDVLERKDLARDARFKTWANRYEERDALAAELEAIVRTRGADDVEALLTRAGLGCVRADGPGHRRFLHEDPHARAIDFMVPTKSPAFEALAPGGQYWRHRPVVNFSETPCEAGKPFEALGRHTEDILEEIGYSPAEIASLKAANVIAGSEPQTN
ncbi:MAG TPA: CoA transferase [Ramlibacter sp.]|nr:CoA transferase [Ramlibacter sp.]